MPAVALHEITEVPGLTVNVLKAADELGVSDDALARVVGVSDAEVARMRACTYSIPPNCRPFKLGALFVRLHLTLLRITHGEIDKGRSWLHASNRALGDAPAHMIQSIPGLIGVIQHLDKHRALA